MAYLINFRLNDGLDFDCDLIDKEAIFLSMDVNYPPYRGRSL